MRRDGVAGDHEHQIDEIRITRCASREVSGCRLRKLVLVHLLDDIVTGWQDREERYRVLHDGHTRGFFSRLPMLSCSSAKRSCR
jgi:hypothetical protein